MNSHFPVAPIRLILCAALAALHLTLAPLRASEEFAIACAAWHDNGDSPFAPMTEPQNRAAPGTEMFSDANDPGADADTPPPFVMDTQTQVIHDPVPPTFGAFFKLLGRDSWSIATAPLHWNGEQWLQIGFAAVVIGATSRYVDHEADRFNRGPNRTRERALWTHVSDWGIAIPYMIIGAHGLIGYTWGQDHAKRVFLDGVESVVIVSAILLAVKISLGRSLPDSRSRAFQFKPFHNGWDTAFPSGHTVQAFVGATVLAASYPDQPWVGISAYAIAGAVGYSRLYLHQHWVTDVMAGAMLAVMVGWEIVSLHKHTVTTVAGPDSPRSSWRPARVGLWANGEQTGLQMEWRF